MLLSRTTLQYIVVYSLFFFLCKKNQLYGFYRRVESRCPDTVQKLSLSLKVHDVYVLLTVLTFEY